jgi:hypothetical protein
MEAREENTGLFESIKRQEKDFLIPKDNTALYYDSDQATSDCPPPEFINLKENIYLKPNSPSRSVEEGMSPEDDLALRVIGSGMIRKVGVALHCQNETIIVSQCIFQRFYFR